MVAKTENLVSFEVEQGGMNLLALRYLGRGLDSASTCVVTGTDIDTSIKCCRKVL